MANIVSNKLTVTGRDAVRVLKVTSARFSENKGEGYYYLDPNGPIAACFSGDVNLPESRRKQRTVVSPEEQRVVIEDCKVVIFFYSKWSTPVWEVQEISRQFPALTFRLRGWDRDAAYGWLFSFTAGRITPLDMREDWTPEQKALAAKYRIRVTSDCFYGGNETRGTILFEDVEQHWNWDRGVVYIRDGDVVIHKSTWREGAFRPEEIYEAVVNELQAGPAPIPRDGDDDSDDDDDPQLDEYVTIKAYSAAAGC
jgi:hypothetical protein